MNEAERLALALTKAVLEEDAEDDVVMVARWFVEDSAAELRRLSAINAELVKTLEQILATKPQTGMNLKAKSDDPIEIKVGWNVHMIARAALEKAKQ